MRINTKHNPNSGLCGKCRKGMIISSGDYIKKIICTHPMNDMEIGFLIENCSEFEDKRFKSEYDFDDIGWILETRKGKFIGFKPPEKKND